jgi:hypothetical protein
MHNILVLFYILIANCRFFFRVDCDQYDSTCFLRGRFRFVILTRSTVKIFSNICFSDHQRLHTSTSTRSNEECTFGKANLLFDHSGVPLSPNISLISSKVNFSPFDIFFNAASFNVFHLS